VSPTGRIWPIADQWMGGRLADELRTPRTAGKSHVDIAAHLEAWGVKVSHATVGTWLNQLGIERPAHLPIKRTPIDVRFERRITKRADGCWEWQGAHDPTGYGITYGDLADGRGYRKLYAHRAAYELYVGPVPKGYDIDHLCHVRGCCNPDHLEPVTRKENLRRGRVMKAHHERALQCPFPKCQTCATFAPAFEAAA
jgi:hypothetical protein